MVGEIRDAETAHIAVQAALTGHQVFTTVHANNVVDVLGRFLNMNVDLYNFVSALNYAYTIDYLEGVQYAREQIGQSLALQGKHDEEDDIYQDIVRRHPGIRRLLRSQR
jgi:type IV secretory pathway ATPase VirB11/archaellum biosynthesis ATPase